MKCKICNSEYKIKGFSTHLKNKHNLTLKQYYDLYIKESGEGYCEVCGGETAFKSLKDGYNKSCSNSCAQKCETTRRKREETSKSRYGTKSPNSCPEVKEKKRDSLKEKYGVENSFQIPEVSDKRNLKLNENKDNISKKRKETNKKLYNAEAPYQNSKIKEKGKYTTYIRYGVENYTHSEEYKNKVIHDTYEILINSGRLQNSVFPLFSKEDLKDSKCGYLWRCNRCNSKFFDSFENGKIPRCPICFPKLSGISQGEKEVLNFIKDKGIDYFENYRELIYPKEVDIYLPYYRLAIEFNGIYYHSEINGGCSKTYHIDKSKRCKEAGVDLIHIFEDEWNENSEIIKSLILNKLGLNSNVVYARKCTIVEVEAKQAKQFYFENHLQGYISGKHIGLEHKGEIVTLVTIGKSRFNKNHGYEILRFCTQCHLNVIGGFDKLVKYIERNISSSLISYVDRRFYSGKSYINYGFEFEGYSPPNYFYIVNKKRENRIKYQKHKLKNKLEYFNENLSEWENMKMNGYDRIWDCGHLIFSLN